MPIDTLVIRSNEGNSTTQAAGVNTAGGFAGGAVLFDAAGQQIDNVNRLPVKDSESLSALTDILAAGLASRAELENLDDTTERGFLLLAKSLSQLLASQNPANELRISVQNGTITTVSTVTTVGTVSTISNISAIAGISPVADQWYASRSAASGSYSRIT